MIVNWGKGKNRLIILFLSINLVLGWANYRKVSGAYLLKDAQIHDIRQVMEMNNVFIDSEIPREYKSLQKLTVFPYQINSQAREVLVRKLLQTLDGVKISVQAPVVPNEKPKRVYTRDEEVVIFEGETIFYHHLGMEQGDRPEVLSEDLIGALEYPIDQELVTPSAIKIQIKEPKKQLDVGVAKKVSEKWLKQMGYSHKEMHIQAATQEDYLEITYYDKYEGTPVFDSYVKMTITPLGIKDMEIHKVKFGSITGERQAIYSADQVFFYLIQEIAGKGPVHIKDIMLGYALENPKGTHLIAEKAIPYYQVVLEDGKTYYIDAYHNEMRE